MNFYKRFIGDIQAKTGSLSMAEFGAYDRLLDHYYSTEEPIPLDAAERYRICRAMTEEEQRSVEKVLAKFFNETPAGYIQSKAEEVISAALPLIEAARENGKKGGRPRRDEKPAGFISETQSEPRKKASQSQNQNTSSSLRSEEDAAKPRATRRKKSECTLQVYLDVCKAAGQKPLPPDHPIRAWCADAGITEDMIQVAWIVFRDDHVTGKSKDKTQKDWPAHFANSVRRRWYQLWYTGDQGVAWTSTGLQEKAVLDARHNPVEGAHAPG